MNKYIVYSDGGFWNSNPPIFYTICDTQEQADDFILNFWGKFYLSNIDKARNYCDKWLKSLKDV